MRRQRHDSSFGVPFSRVAVLAVLAVASGIPLHRANGQRKAMVDTSRRKDSLISHFQPPPPANTVVSDTAPLCGLTATLIRRPQIVTAVITPLLMPDFSGKYRVGDAEAWLTNHRVSWRSGQIRTRGPFDTVLAQAPPTKMPISAGDTVVLCWRLPEQWPPVIGLPYEQAAKVLIDSGYVTFRRDSIATADTLVGVVVAQRPLAGTPADSGSTDTLFVGVAAPPPPPPDTLRMPDLVGRDLAFAEDTLGKLGLRGQPRGPNGATLQKGQRIVDSQFPNVGTPVRPQSTVVLVLKPVGTGVPWPLIIAGVVLLAAAVTIARGRAHLNAIEMVPHADRGTQRLAVTSGTGPTQDNQRELDERAAQQELAKLGFSVNVVIDPGSQRLRVPQTPPTRDESSDA